MPPSHYCNIAINWSAGGGHNTSPNIPYQGFAYKPLYVAHFGSSRIRHPTRIAAFISAVAPNLVEHVAWEHTFYKIDPGLEKYSSRWKLVQRLIKSFSTFREQERRTLMPKAGEGAERSNGNEEFGPSANHYGVVQPAQETENGEAAASSDTDGDEGGSSEDEGDSSDEDSGSEGE
ncbi:uncharacterized protein EDB91DRAFT_1258361 [Suillus paluster]|uniref:uncharacterized protein n=1 Tax=Suillus paluster TaxID=48578 RepID=UPI001B862575|nr:uncharacterized protein EDB91DRAFT_1258361 [Suillus paluster]KAG1718676.1 hypothetical protein EDB91DRAFT_1258361 [Suillus paluster]